MGLDEDDEKIFRDKKINGRAFLKMTDDKFERCGFEIGTATNLADFAKECKDKKLKAFSSYLSLSEVLAEYGLDSDGIDSIPLFNPKPTKFKKIIKFSSVVWKKFWVGCAPTDLYNRIAWTLCVMNM